MAAREKARSMLKDAPHGKQRAKLKQLLLAATTAGKHGLPAFAPIVEAYLKKKERNWG